MFPTACLLAPLKVVVRFIGFDLIRAMMGISLKVLTSSRRYLGILKYIFIFLCLSIYQSIGIHIIFIHLSIYSIYLSICHVDLPVGLLSVLVAVEGDVTHRVERHLALHKLGTVWTREQGLKYKSLDSENKA